jgi:hypothetical protein
MKLKATPPKPVVDDHDERIAAIISGATAASPVPSAPPAVRQGVSAPWKAPHVRRDLLV